MGSKQDRLEKTDRGDCLQHLLRGAAVSDGGGGVPNTEVGGGVERGAGTQLEP